MGEFRLGLTKVRGGKYMSLNFLFIIGGSGAASLCTGIDTQFFTTLHYLLAVELGDIFYFDEYIWRI